MPSSKALKAACLSVGLATAWAPIGTPVAKGDTVEVNLSFGASTSFYGYQNLFLGLLLHGGGTDVRALNVTEIPAGVVDYTNFFDVPDTVDGFVMAGLVKSTNDVNPQFHVVVSIADYAGIAESEEGDDFSDVFHHPPFPTEAEITGSPSDVTITSFLGQILSSPPAGVLGTPGDGLFHIPSDGVSQVYAFSAGSGIGELHVYTTPSAAAVPLPPGVLMGGALLGLLASGKRGAAWIRARAASNMPCD